MRLGSVNVGKKTPSRTKTPGKQGYADRFIPNRDAMNAGLQLHSIANENAAPEEMGEETSEYKSTLAQSLFAGDDVNSKILAFKHKAPLPTEGFQNKLRVLYSQNKDYSGPVKRTTRVCSQTKVLDAPEMVDDFYLNLLDWSTANDHLAIALGGMVYLYNPEDGAIETLCELRGEEDIVTSLQWSQDGQHVAVGTSSSVVQLWNVERKKCMRVMRSHTARVGALAWNNHILSSASRDMRIVNHDVRIAAHEVAHLVGHEQEICGLKWSPDGTQLASGGNDNLVMIWDASAGSSGPRHRFADSAAAVKALAWCPWQPKLLAAGGGTADRHIRFYNTLSGSLVNSIDTKSQVCSLVWSRHEKEILSGHGFSQNQLSVWKYPSMVKVADLHGHTSRVLHTALSADGSTVCSAAADETLRFWKVWEPAGKAPSKGGAAASVAAPSRSMLAVNIR